MRGTETLNRASQSIARSTQVAVETGKFVMFAWILNASDFDYGMLLT